MRKHPSTLAAAVVTTLALSGCWLQPGFNAGRTNHNPDEDTLTAETVPALTELWSTATGPGSSHPPIVNSGTVYVTGENNAASLRLSDGAVNWLNGEVVTQPPAGTPSVEAPAYHEDQVVVPFTGGYTGSGSSSGGTVRIDPETGDVVGTTGSDPGIELARAEGNLALRVANGNYYAGIIFQQINWTFPRRPVVTWSFGSSHSAGDFAIVGERILWSFDTLAQGYSEDCPQVGETNYCTEDWSTDLGAAPGRPVALGTDHVAYSAGGTTFVLDAATGGILWTADAGGGLAVADNNLYVADAGTGRLVALPADGCGAATCGPLWEAAVADLDGRPSVGGDVVYVRTDTGDLHAFASDGCGAATCSPLVTVDTAHELHNNLVVAQGRVLARTYDDQVVAFGLPD